MKVLFVGHDATRTGAPILFFTLLRWLKENTPLQFEILLKNGGVLEPQYAGVAWHKVFNVDTARLAFLRRFLQKRDLLAGYRNSGVKLVYNNTITNGAVLEYLSPLNLPVLTHVHELENYIRSCGEENFAQVKRYTTLFIAPSRAVEENLVRNHGIPLDRIQIVPEFIHGDAFNALRFETPREQMLQRLGIPADAFVVGAVGTTDWRKSPDLFVQMAVVAARRYPQHRIHFVWVGVESGWELGYDVEKAGIHNITFVPPTPELADFYNCFDLLTLTSRIDPCPLVCLEAAALGKPIICFAGAGGMPEFVEDDAGFVVPYLDVNEMVARVADLCEHRDLCASLGERARAKVFERHDVAVAGPEIFAMIMNQLDNRVAS